MKKNIQYRFLYLWKVLSLFSQNIDFKKIAILFILLLSGLSHAQPSEPSYSILHFKYINNNDIEIKFQLVENNGFMGGVYYCVQLMVSGSEYETKCDGVPGFSPDNTYALIFNNVPKSSYIYGLIRVLDFSGSFYPDLQKITMDDDSHSGISVGISKSDEVSGPLPIGFNFKYYGKEFSEFYVGTNGVVGFNPIDKDGWGEPCYGPPQYSNNSLSVFGTRLAGHESSVDNVMYQTIGEAPNRQLVIQWSEMDINSYSYRQSLGNFQVILYEGSNEIKYQYHTINYDDYTMSYAYIGLIYSEGLYTSSMYIDCKGPFYDMDPTPEPKKSEYIKANSAILITPNESMTDYSVDKEAPYNFIDIKGLGIGTVYSDYWSNQGEWYWNKVEGFNNYEIEIQTESGITVDTVNVGNNNTFIYPDELVHGNRYKARVRGSHDNGLTWREWTTWSNLLTIDSVDPTYSINHFKYTGNKKAELQIRVFDDKSGPKEFCVKLMDGLSYIEGSSQCLNYYWLFTSRTFTFNNIPESSEVYGLVNVWDHAGNSTGWQPVTLGIESPSITSPISGSTVTEPEIIVSGYSKIIGNIQLYLDQQKVGTVVKTDSNGYFSIPLTFTQEGRFRISADVTNSTGEASSKGSAVQITFNRPSSIAKFVTPSEGVTLNSAQNKIEVSVNDTDNVEKVELLLDGETLSVLTAAPFEYLWASDMSQNGQHRITAKITNTYDHTVTIHRDVLLDILPPPPEPAPYLGEIVSVYPAISYGSQSILIKGKGMTHDGDIVTNSPLTLVLQVNGFKRSIDVLTNSQGNFEYNFVPQESDAGIYTVSLAHPNFSDFVEQGTFTIDRIAFNYHGFNLKAVRTVETSFTVNTTTSAGAEELRWVMRAEDQPMGQLPQGIEVDNGAGIKVLPNKATPMKIKFTADNTANQRGSIMLVALAKGSGDMIRGQLQLNYELADATPALTAQPIRITTGLSQNETIVEAFTVTNKGSTAAKNVKVELLTTGESPADSWLFVSNNGKAGTVDIGQNITVQITINPNDAVANGIYNFIARVTSDNGPGGDIPLSISITQSGRGSVQFDVADIYTQTLNEQGQPILGVNNVTIKLQNDAVLTEQYTIKSDANGIAMLEDVPTGIYRYRASAIDHIDTSGRLMVRPGVTVDEHVFLEYQLINIDFDVTEKTIDDEYEIDIDATFKTDVPAPVVVIEPLSINLAGLKDGDIKTGQLTISNYGLVQAENIVFTPPISDNRYQYEFLGEVPSVLLPKETIVIPYKVTVIDSTKSFKVNRNTTPIYTMRTTESCNSYYGRYDVNYESECANGDISRGNSKGNFYRLSGTSCNPSSGGGWNGSSNNNNNPGWTGGNSSWGGGGSLGGNGGWISGGNSGPSPMPMSLGCIPVCTDACSITGGMNAGNE